MHSLPFFSTDGSCRFEKNAPSPFLSLSLALNPEPPPPSPPTSSETKQAIDKYTIEKDIAAYIKKEFDRRHSPLWHCVVGRNFGAERERERERAEKTKGEKNSRERKKEDEKEKKPHFFPSLFLSVSTSKTTPPGSYVTHETKHFIYFYLGHYAVLLFKSG